LQGNWSLPLRGFQVSLRFPTNKYSIGQPIMAVVLVRNVSSNLIYFGSPDGQAPVTFVVADDTRRSVKVKPSGVQQPWSSKGVGLQPKTQRKYLERLDNRFELTRPGTYVISAVMALDGGNFEIQSGNALVEIVEGPATTPTPEIPVKGVWSAEQLRAVDARVPTPPPPVPGTEPASERAVTQGAPRAVDSQPVMVPPRPPASVMTEATTQPTITTKIDFSDTGKSGHGTKNLWYGLAILLLLSGSGLLLWRSRRHQS
jgi:LPXTG-motif cell wall-anchored protein